METSSIDYNQIIDNTHQTIINPSFYWELLAVAACVIAAVGFYKIFKKILLIKFKNPEFRPSNNIQKIFAKYIAPLFLPMLVIMFLSVGFTIFSEFYNNIILFPAIIQLTALFLFLRFLHVFFDSAIIAKLAATFLAPILLLNIFGVLEPTVDYLDSYAVEIGKMRISIYQVIKTSVILMVVFWVSGLVSSKSKSYINRNKDIKSSTKGVLSKILDIAIYFIVFVIILKVLGVNMTTFAVIGGALGVGIGLGMQKIASNFMSGIILLFEKSVEVGDLVELMDGNNSIIGTITHFGGRYTMLETFDGKEVTLPNEDLIIHKVVNLTYSNSRGRVEIKSRISYDSDPKIAQELMIEAAKQHPRCLNFPSPECYVTEFGENGIEIVIFFWISNVLEGRLGPKSDVFISIWEKFKENNIKIPVPQREIINDNSLTRR